MRVLDSLEGLRGIPQPLFVSLGVFDGVHLGHQAVLARATAAVTFDPHPAEVVSGRRIALLCTLKRRLARMEAAGLKTTVLLRFDATLAATSPEAFLRRLAGLGMKHLVLGYDSHFGRDRQGDADSARLLGPSLGFEVETVEALPVGGSPVSSRRIREALARGDLEDARACLGSAWVLEGKVIRGDGRGRGLGFPTANLETGNLILPKRGVYAGRATAGGKVFPAAVNIGIRPTVGGDGANRAEVHLVGFSGDLYGQDLAVEMLDYLRGERKFDSLDALKGQIARDVDRVSALP